MTFLKKQCEMNNSGLSENPFPFPFCIKKEGNCLLSETRFFEQSFQIKSFEPKFYPDWLKKLEIYRSAIAPENGLNWTPERLNFKEQKAISVFLQNGKIKGFCTAWHRESYPPQTARVLNRYWLDKNIRTISKTVFGPRALLALEHQSLILRDKGFQWIFISRHFGNKKWPWKAKDILNKYSRCKNWRADDDLFLVCPNPSDSTCWQRVIFAGLNDNPKFDFGLLRHRLSREEFIEKFKTSD